MESYKLIFILMIFSGSNELSSQSTNEKKEILKVSKYKYMLPKTPLDKIDSTRNLKPEDLELIEYFDPNRKRLKTEKYLSGKLINTQMFNENKEVGQITTGAIRDTIKGDNEYDSKSMYGTVIKTLDKLGLETGRSDEKYDAKYNSNGDLIAEYIMNREGDTISNFKHYYDDSNFLLRTEMYEKGVLKNTRIYLRGGGNENWSQMVFFGETGEIRTDEWTKFYTVSPSIKKSTTVLKWDEGEDNQSTRNAIFFMDDQGNTSKAVYEVNEEILVIEFKHEIIKNQGP